MPDTESLEHTYLIQRLEARPGEKGKAQAINQDQVFGMGGGGGQLTEQAWSYLYDIWRFEYMGAAEFEHGAIPTTIKAMIAEPTLVTWNIEMNGKQVYIIAPAIVRNEIEERLGQLAVDNMRLKEWSHFPEILGTKPAYGKLRTVGWLELNNHFFFTVDREMNERFWAFLQMAKGAKS